MDKVLDWNKEIFNSLMGEKLYFDIVFIGGGPSTLSFFSYLIKNKQLDKFLNKKILIIDKSSSFGSGCLGKYGINTNTSAEGFLRLIAKTKEDKNNNYKSDLSPYKKNDIKANSFTPLDEFKELFNSPISKEMLKIGSKPSPLSIIGEFLQHVGKIILNIIYEKTKKIIFLSETSVTKVLLNNLINHNEYELTLQRSSDSKIIKSKIIILATGGIPKSFPFKEKLSTQSELYLTSDFALSKEGYFKMIKHIAKIPKRKSKIKILIIGGSHSGFSSAWLLLNGPANKSIKHYSSCSVCRKIDNCSCLSQTFSLQWNKQDQKYDKDELELHILYRDHIKVYYSTEKEAIKDNYTCYDPFKAVNKNLNVYPFIGIRSDAKELYRNIFNNKEERVKLIKFPDENRIPSYVKEHNFCIIIYAGGYETNSIPFFTDNYKNSINFLYDNGGTFEISNDMGVFDSNKCLINNLYGIGQGYSTHSSEVCNDGRKAKADSVNLYNTTVAQKLMKSLEAALLKIPNHKPNVNLNTGVVNKTSLSPLSKGYQFNTKNNSRIINEKVIHEDKVSNSLLHSHKNPCLVLSASGNINKPEATMEEKAITKISNKHLLAQLVNKSAKKTINKQKVNNRYNNETIQNIKVNKSEQINVGNLIIKKSSYLQNSNYYYFNKDKDNTNKLPLLNKNVIKNISMKDISFKIQKMSEEVRKLAINK